MSIKPLYIPYMGSKNKIAHELISEMRLYKPNAKYFIDLFGGGGAMSFMALQMGFNVLYNEYDSDLFNFVEFLMNRIKNNERSEYGLLPKEYYNFVTRDEFKKQKELNTPYAEFCKVCYSFGNNRKDYLCNPELEKIKHLAHDFVVFGCEDSLKKFNKLVNINLVMPKGGTILKRRLDYRKQLTENSNRIDLEQLEQLERLEQLEQLQRLERLEQLQQLKQLQQLERLQQLEHLQHLQRLQQLELSNKSYNDVDLAKFNDDDVIIYCDPPYRGTGEYLKSFDYNLFDDWLRKQDKTIFISEYTMPDDFIQLFSINKRVTLSSTNNNLVKKEIIFCNKNIKLHRKQLSLF